MNVILISAPKPSEQKNKQALWTKFDGQLKLEFHGWIRMLTIKTKSEKLLAKSRGIFDLNRRFALLEPISMNFVVHMGSQLKV